MLRLLIVIFFICNCAYAQQKEQRGALVIGNGAYKASPLRNPVNDAKAISIKLTSLGFKVTTLENTTLSQLKAELNNFKNTSLDADLVVLFYSGHGLHINGQAHILSVDAGILNIKDVTEGGLSLNSIIENFILGKKRLIFYDSSLDAPFGSQTLSQSFNDPDEALISYATKRGSDTQDGDGKNSPFTTALLEHIGDPDDIAVVLRKVREKVMKSTGGKQQPWEYGSLTGGALVLSAIKAK